MSLRRNRLWAFGSGKGGVGNSFLAASIGTALAREGKSVIIVDAHLASPNLYASLGNKAPAYTLLDVLDRQAGLADALTATAEPQLRCLSCVADELGMADIPASKQEKMSEVISCLDADYVLIDAGNGVSLSVLDFFNLADEALVVVSPDPALMQCSYNFIKHSVFRKVQKQYGRHQAVGAALLRMDRSAREAKPQTMSDFLDSVRPSAADVAEGIAGMVDAFRPLMLINMAASEQDQRIAEIIQSAARKFLNVDVRLAGPVAFDATLHRPARRTRLPDGRDPDCASGLQIRQIALRLAGNASLSGADDAPADSIPFPAALGGMGLNDNLAVMGKDLHIQTEDLGDSEGCITTQVFFEGRVILSTKSEYPPELRDSEHSSRVVELMRAQHFNVIREIESRKMKLQSNLE